MDIKVGDLLANIRKAVDDDIDSIALPSTASQARGTLMRGVLREMRVTMNAEQASGPSVREEIETLRDRIKRKGEAVSLLGSPAPRAIEKPADPPLIDQKPKPSRGDFSGILAGARAEPMRSLRHPAPQTPPALRPSMAEQDHFSGDYRANDRSSYRDPSPGFNDARFGQQYQQRDAWADEQNAYVEDYKEPDYEQPSQHYHDRATQAYPLVPQQPMMSEQAEAATESAFRHLSETILARATGDRGLEDMTREMLRGMIKQWLDAHLPALVEELVREEIERVARKGR